MKDNDDTTRLQPTFRSPYDNKYVAQVVNEQVDERQWIMHFIVSKHLTGLLEVSIYRLYKVISNDCYYTVYKDQSSA